MTQEIQVGWPLVRERMVKLAHLLQTELRNPALRLVTNDDTIFDRVATIIELRASAMVQDLA
jgi:hypothetical protein